ncbi:MAG: hypothetical protein JWQ88_1270 [Rhodoferax sp.]|nr:hypothetical protein [Rhodoferax sp.]
MDFDGIARSWANETSLTSPIILAALVDYNPQQLGQLRASVSRYEGLAHAIQMIDVLTAFQLAKQRLGEAQQAAQRMADIAAKLAMDVAGVPTLALASVETAVHAQEAAHLALEKAQSGRERIQAAVVLELADAAAAKALEAAEAAEKLTQALAGMVRATAPIGVQNLAAPHLADHATTDGQGASKADGLQ